MSSWINGSEQPSGYNPEVTVQQQCGRWTDFIVSEARKNPDESGWSENTPYTTISRPGWTEYMLAGGGPSAWLRIIFDTSDVVKYGVVEYSESNRAYNVISARDAALAHQLLSRPVEEARDVDE